jgi:hypothetical protein
LSVEGLEGFEFAPYFERRVLNNPERRHLLPYVADTVNEPEEIAYQEDGKLQHYKYVEWLGHHVRVTTTADGALFDAHEDSNYTRKKRRQNS